MYLLHRADRTSFKEIGATFAIKDNIVTSDLPTSCASNILRGYAAPENASVVKFLKQAGLTMLGKTNMDEFGMGSHSRNSAFGPVERQVNDMVLSVGGSSGGSALLVASGFAHFGIGTDTGGSVRLPAAYLNIIGFKPSYGRISRYGVVPYANSLDTVGLFATSCESIQHLFRILDRHDAKDPTSMTSASRDLMGQKKGLAQKRPATARGWKSTPTTSEQMRKKRIGVPIEYNVAEMQNGVRDAWLRSLNMLVARGHEIVPVSLPSTRLALSAYYVLAPAEASSNLAKYDGVRYGAQRSSAAGEDVLYSKHRGEQFGEEVKRRILLGTYSLSAGAMDNYFIQAQKVRRLVQHDFDRVLSLPNLLREELTPTKDGVDFIVCPTAPTFPPRVSSLARASPVETYTNDVLTVPASLAGLPAVSIPAPPSAETLTTGADRAVGIQVIGQYWTDDEVLRFAEMNFEGTQDWSQNHQATRKTTM